MPTIRQERAVQLLGEKGREYNSQAEWLKEAGYGKQIQTQPYKVTQSEGFIECMEKAGLTDKNLTKKHNSLLNSENENIGIKALELAYKVKGKFKEEGGDTSITINTINFN